MNQATKDIYWWITDDSGRYRFFMNRCAEHWSGDRPLLCRFWAEDMLFDRAVHTFKNTRGEVVDFDEVDWEGLGWLLERQKIIGAIA